MAKYITLRCIYCNYEKVYAERFADGRRCPKCNSGLYIPVENIFIGIDTSNEADYTVTASDRCIVCNSIIPEGYQICPIHLQETCDLCPDEDTNICDTCKRENKALSMAAVRRRLSDRRKRT